VQDGKPWTWPAAQTVNQDPDKEALFITDESEFGTPDLYHISV
jgi:hypothetical protein